jgi:hypothetical protein
MWAWVDAPHGGIMHGRFEKPGRSDSGFIRNIGVGFLVLPVLIAIALLALAISQPTASNWIAEAAQAEFAGDTGVPPGQSPTQLAQPAAEPHMRAADWIHRVQAP